MSAPFVLALRVILAMSLYTFLGWTLYTIWKEIRTQGTLLAARKIPGINLTFQVGDQPPSRLFFTHSEILLGRDAHCDIPLFDDTVSVRHARLSHHHGQWWLEDLGSTNGTKLNDDKVSIPTVVINGDRVECGKATINISLGIDANNPPTQRIQDLGETG